MGMEVVSSLIHGKVVGRHWLVDELTTVIPLISMLLMLLLRLGSPSLLDVGGGHVRGVNLNWLLNIARMLGLALGDEVVLSWHVVDRLPVIILMRCWLGVVLYPHWHLLAHWVLDSLGMNL